MRYFNLKIKKISLKMICLFSIDFTPYMDDILWIADSKKELTNILQIAQSFYNFANILVNLNKSVLATTCSNTANHIEFNNTTIPAINKKESFRFLGC